MNFHFLAHSVRRRRRTILGQWTFSRESSTTRLICSQEKDRLREEGNWESAIARADRISWCHWHMQRYCASRWSQRAVGFDWPMPNQKRRNDDALWREREGVLTLVVLTGESYWHTVGSWPCIVLSVLMSLADLAPLISIHKAFFFSFTVSNGFLVATGQYDTKIFRHKKCRML